MGDNRMKILDEHSRWWKGVEKEWAVEDKNGDWWIFKDEKKKVAIPKKKKTTMKHNLFRAILIALVIIVMALAGGALATILNKHLFWVS